MHSVGTVFLTASGLFFRVITAALDARFIPVLPVLLVSLLALVLLLLLLVLGYGGSPSPSLISCDTQVHGLHDDEKQAQESIRGGRVSRGERG